MSGVSPNLTGFTTGLSTSGLKLFKSHVSTSFTTGAYTAPHYAMTAAQPANLHWSNVIGDAAEGVRCHAATPCIEKDS
jgi:hypothetical protein